MDSDTPAGTLAARSVGGGPGSAGGRAPAAGASVGGEGEAEVAETARSLRGDLARMQAARRLRPGPASVAALDRLAALAAGLLGTSSSHVSLLDDAQLVAAGAGLAVGAIGSRGPMEDSLCTVTVGSEAPLVIEDARADGRVSALRPVASGQVGSYLGVPLTGPDGLTVGALCVYDTEPRAWSGSDVALLQQLSTSVLAELTLGALTAEYEAGQVILDLALDAAGVGTFDWDLTTGVLRWDDRLTALFGYSPGKFEQTIEAFNSRLHPQDLPRVTAEIADCMSTGAPLATEYRIVRPDGDTRWVSARGQSILDPSGRAVRLLGAAYDTTSVQEGDARVSRVLESMSAAFYSLDRQWRFSYVNAEAERLLGRPRDELLGQSVWELFPAAVGSAFESTFREAVATGRPATFEAYYPTPLEAWYELRAWPGPDGLSVYFLDITARRLQQAQAERDAARSSILGLVTTELAGTLDAAEAARRLAQAIVPALCDWCVVSITADDDVEGTPSTLRDVGWWHADPQARPLVERYASLRMAAVTEHSYLAQALRTSSPVVVPSGASRHIAAILEPGLARDTFVELSPESLIVLPMRARGRTLGLLTMFRGPDRPAPGRDEVATAVDVAARAGLALDNARLYAAQRQLAEALQRALLTEPPEPDHMQVVVRYEPAVESAQVGGDWYDAFLQPDGATMLVIGDVIGHDTAAAAAMGQVRSLLRGIAAHTGDGPAEVLCGVDRVLETLQIATTATAVVARLEQDDDERARGITRLRWSNAGHPPPMVVNADRTVTVLAGAEADLLLGIDPHASRVESEVILDRGSTVLLYTDGLVERRGQSLDEGLARLRELLARVGGEPLDVLCDQTLRAMLPARPEDDVALVAVRLHRQDRPRPAEAGPTSTPPNVEPGPRT